MALWNERKTCNDISVTPPIALMPSPFPAELFEKAKSVQQTLSELYFRISMDHDFLVESYKDVVKADKVGLGGTSRWMDGIICFAVDCPSD